MGKMSDCDDDILLEWTAAGDAAAFTVLVRRHQRRIVGFACRLLDGDLALAEDAAQETFLRLWRVAPTYRSHGTLTAYLFRIVRNLCADLRRAARPTVPLDTLSHYSVNDDALQDQRTTAAAVQKALTELPDAQREVFILSHYEGLSYQEIADLLGCPPGTVASRKYHATLGLRRCLAGELEMRDEG